MLIAAVFTIAKTQKQPKYLTTDNWLKKMWYIHTHISLCVCVCVCVCVYEGESVSCTAVSNSL